MFILLTGPETKAEKDRLLLQFIEAHEDQWPAGSKSELWANGVRERLWDDHPSQDYPQDVYDLLRQLVSDEEQEGLSSFPRPQDSPTTPDGHSSGGGLNLVFANTTSLSPGVLNWVVASRTEVVALQ